MPKANHWPRLKPQYRLPAKLIGSTLLVAAIATFYLATTAHPHKVRLAPDITQQVLPPAASASVPKLVDQEPIFPEAALIRRQLHQYLTQVTATADVSVSFANLAPQANSPAAKRADDPLNTAGSVKVNALGTRLRLAGSSTHLAIAAYLSHLQATGAKTWTASDSAGMKMMLANNGPYYANTILQRYGKVTLNRYLEKLGLTPPFSYVAEDQTTTNDLVSLLRLLADQQPPFAHRQMQRRIRRDLQAQVRRNGICAGVKQLLPQAQVQNITGQLGYSMSDAAIVTLPDGHRFMLAIMTTSPTADFNQIQAIAKAVTHVVYFRG
ncbi:serine hydrolase [Lacticaseibacillus baoqingensis]|uniref:Serine hydrolase n=1 Tax=Lacticaseibacillus baoqingensis TaxID=2486013 RepID=A0ABW4E835_9LACO|nr:serine hydrolase [Lacticaseibacillus baoqingensis]